MSNLVRLRALMEKENVSALLVTDLLNIRWVSGFTGSSGVVVVTPSDAIFITDSRYTLQAAQQVTEMPQRVFSTPDNLDGVLGQELTRMGVKELGFETSQSYSEWQRRSKLYDGVTWTATDGLIENLRRIKTPAEIAKIREACKLADACMEHVSRMLQPGISEYDLGLDVEFFYRRHGALLAFEPIVVSGPNSAKPHGKPGERLLEVGDFVTIDCGGKLDGYCSDITRTFLVGKASDRHREIYDQVLKSQIAACAALKPGVDGKAVDQMTRDILNEKDLAQYFGHGLGHGLGLNVHDPGRLTMTVSEILEPGMVLTVEPGVYIEGFGGVRIEDDVLVTEGEPDILTSFPKELIEA
ncbi:MAG: Xaa-Pro peptidase family protein [Armatimonadetes bacterium]|nr:Xaa-Pro peptidase family protein [Armatimonadota bacterium]